MPSQTMTETTYKEALAEIDLILLLLEAELPGNQRSPKNLRLAKRLERLAKSYFQKLERAFPYSKLGSLYNRNVKESLGSETRGMLDPLLATFHDKFQADIEGQLAEIYLSGQAEMVTWGKTKAGVPIAYEGPPSQKAIDYARLRLSKGKLVDGIDETTLEKLSRTISDGIKNKRGIPGISKDIRDEFKGMTKYRSELIARTETAQALSQASLDTMADMGIDGKEWVTAGDDQVSDDCLGNEAEGVIPRGQTFSGGVDAPPQHPDCRCTIAPARLPK